MSGKVCNRWHVPLEIHCSLGHILFMAEVVEIKGVCLLRNSACVYSYACNGKNLVIIFVSFFQISHFFFVCLLMRLVLNYYTGIPRSKMETGLGGSRSGGSPVGL